MSTPEEDGFIRPMAPGDVKELKILVGRSRMEQLAAANVCVYGNPIFIALWIGLSSIALKLWNDWTHWWTAVPMFASMILPLIFFVDYINRPYFEQWLQDAVRRIDVATLETYYDKASASAFWILERKGRILGFIALDASSNGALTELPTVDKAEPSEMKPRPSDRKDAFIRHYWVEEKYRPAYIQSTLLEHCKKHASDKGVTIFYIWVSPFEGYITKALRKENFHLLPDYKSKAFGILRWQSKLWECK